MIFDFSSQSHSHWETLLKLKKQLSLIANSPITSSTTERDSLENSVIQFLRSNLFDSVQGGFYQRHDNFIKLDTYHNGLLAEFFLLADRTLYHGEPTYYAVAMLDKLINSLWDRDKGIFASAIEHRQKQIPFAWSGQSLVSLLSTEELKLLSALIKVQVIEPENDYIINYQHSLKEAATLADIPFKLAQIHDGQIVVKLQSNPPDCHQPIMEIRGINWRVNCQMLNTMTQAILWNDQRQFLSTAQNLHQTLFSYFDDTDTAQDYTQATLIDITYALVEFQQVTFDQYRMENIASSFANKIARNLDDLSPKSRFQLGVIQSVFDYFNCGDAAESIRSSVDLSSDGVAETDGVIAKIHLLECRPDSYLQKQALLAKYDCHTRVFIEN